MIRLILIACLVQLYLGQVAYAQCTLVAQVDSLHSVRCVGDSTGSVFLSTTGTLFPVSFFLNGSAQALSAANLIGTLPAGLHQVIAEDTQGCRDTLQFSIPTPDTLQVQVFTQNIACNGDNTGRAWALLTGGTPPLSLTWHTCAGASLGSADTLTNLFEGCYVVVVTDAQGCVLSDTLHISAPPPLAFSFVTDSVRCFGGNDGHATVTVTGGTPTYKYLWNNLQTTPAATGLPAGFHSIIVMDSLGCEAAALVEIFQPTALMLDSIFITPVQCFGQSNGTAQVVMQPGSGTPPYRYNWGQGPSLSPLITTLNAGVHTVTVTDAQGCSLIARVDILQPSLLMANALDIKSEVCAGDCLGEATIAVSGGTMPYDFMWDKPTIPKGTSMPKNLCPGQYSVTVTDFRGCTRQEKFSIVPGKPFDFRFDRISPTCPDRSDGSIVSNITGGVMPYKYRWNTGDTTTNITNLPCGKYELTLTDSAGCVQVSTVELGCPPPVQVQSTLTQAVRCYNGRDGWAEVKSSGGTGILTYLWSDPKNQNTVRADSLMAGIYTVTVSDAQGCTATGTLEVKQPEELIVKALFTSVTCHGGNDGSASATATGGTLSKTFFWSNQQATPQITDLAAGTYTVTATDATGCTDTTTVAVTQPADPLLLDIRQPRIACFQESNGIVEATVSGGNGGPFTYSWDNGATSAALTGLSKTTLALTVTDSKGCTRSATFQSAEYDPVVINIISSRPTCYGYSDAKAILNKIKGGVAVDTTGRFDLFTYTWSHPGAPDSDTLLAVPAGLYTVTATDSLGCSGTKVFSIIEAEKIAIQLDKQDISCFGLNDGSVQIKSAVGLYPIVGYAWSNGTSGTSIAALGPGTHTVTLTDTQGCKQADSVLVLEPPPIRIDFSATSLLCSGDQTAQVSATISGGKPDYTLLWNTGATDASLTRLGAGMYALFVTDQNGCTFQDSVTIERPDSLAVTLQLMQPSCFGQSNGRIGMVVSGGQSPYRFSKNGEDFGGSSVFIGLQAGTYTLWVRDAKGCTLSTQTTLQQPLPVQVSLVADTAIVLRDSLLLTAQVTQAVGDVQYSWKSSWGSDLSCAEPDTCREVWVSPVYQNLYTVRATDENGCYGEAQIRVSVEKPRGVYVPAGFTPNEDGANDLLSVLGKQVQVKRIVRFQVYDRWGELVYEDFDFPVNEAGRGWDGRLRGQPCAPGTYVWQAEAEYWDGYTEVVSGGTVLLR